MDKIESTIINLFKNLPHLRADTRKHISQNLWIVACVVAAFQIIVALHYLQALIDVNRISAAFGIASTTTGLSLQLIISLAAAGLASGLAIRAVKPLQNMQIAGWKALLRAAIICLLAQILLLIISMVYMIYFYNSLTSVLAFLALIYVILEAKSGFKSTKAEDKNGEL